MSSMIASIIGGRWSASLREGQRPRVDLLRLINVTSGDMGAVFLGHLIRDMTRGHHGSV
jgi:hypothetical protein